MASSKDYLEYILEQLSDLDEISHRAMMGEYIIYYRGKIIGGIYDDRFLVKPVKSAIAMMPNADMELPYEGQSRLHLIWDKSISWCLWLWGNQYQLEAFRRRALSGCDVRMCLLRERDSDSF